MKFNFCPSELVHKINIFIFIKHYVNEHPIYYLTA